MTTRFPVLVLMVAVLILAVAGCGKSSTEPDAASDYNPQIPAAWAEAVTNPFFSLVPGTTAEFQGETDEGTETVIVEVLSAKRTVNGVSATVVRDQVYLDGELTEDTHDWYAQDEAGNVWYLGEDSKEIEDGEVVSTEGSWEWGVDGALPGIIMWGNPAQHVGEAYRQEYYEDEAEDWGKVVALDQTVEVPYGTLTGCVQTEDWNALEPGPHESKFYCPEIGVVLEVSMSDGERVELIDFTRR